MRGLLLLIRKYHYVLLFIALEIFAFTLLSRYNAYQHSAIVNANREITGFIYSKFEGVREYLFLKKNNELLVEENSSLRNQVNMLKQKMGADSIIFLKEQSYLYKPAHVVHGTFYKQYNYFTINKGKKQGVKKDMGVISENGVVGIVLESSPNFATIIPIINRDFRLSAKIKNNDYVGILQWDGKSPETAILTEIPQHADIAIGDSIVTSGFSAIFPEGQYVGIIKDYSKLQGNFYQINIDLGTEFQSLFHVNVINNYNQKEQIDIEATNSK